MQVRRWVANEAKRARYVQKMIIFLSLLLKKLLKLETWNFGYDFTTVSSNASSKMSCERSEASSLWTKYYCYSVAIIEWKLIKLETWNFAYNFTAIGTNASSKMSCERSEANSLYTKYDFTSFAIIGKTIKARDLKFCI